MCPIDPDNPPSWRRERGDHATRDSTTERDFALQRQADDSEAMRDVVHYARRVRYAEVLTQVDLTYRIDVLPETIGNWERAIMAQHARPEHWPECSTRGPSRPRWF